MLCSRITSNCNRCSTSPGETVSFSPKTEVHVQQVKKKRSRSDVGVGAHKCDLCGRYYSSKSNLKRHSVIHIMNSRKSVGSRTITPKGATTRPKRPSVKCRCPQCGLLLSSGRALSAHLLVHNDSRPYACRYCVWTFKRRDTLANHLKRLHKKSATVAAACPWQSGGSSTMALGTVAWSNNRSQREAAFRLCQSVKLELLVVINACFVREDEKPYSCPKCPLTHNRKDGLSSHIRRCKHGEVSTGGDLSARQVQRVAISTAIAPFKRIHGKSKKLARSMSYGAVGKSGYNMRNRDRAPTPSAVGSTSSVENDLARDPLSAPKLPVKKSHTIVMVGDIRFSTPRLMRSLTVTRLHPEIQGCETYEQWFWKDYYKSVEEMCTAPLIVSKL
ncbi:putative zinc finger protein, partial [Orchesella cincta]